MLVSDEREVVFRWRLRGGALTGDSDFRGREIREIAGFGWGIGRPIRALGALHFDD